MKILLIEPFFTGSHKSWAEGYYKNSEHEIEILKLNGYFWKWRMHGGAVTLARRFMESAIEPDVILATDMLDTSTFLSLTRKKTHDIPVFVYFHENQLMYPWSIKDTDKENRRDVHYAFLNFSTALSADRVFF